MLSGSTGSGKSFWLNGAFTQAQQYGGRTLILDEGSSYKALTRAIKGSYISVRPEDVPFKINVFKPEVAAAARQFPFRFTST